MSLFPDDLDLAGFDHVEVVLFVSRPVEELSRLKLLRLGHGPEAVELLLGEERESDFVF